MAAVHEHRLRTEPVANGAAGAAALTDHGDDDRRPWHPVLGSRATPSVSGGCAHASLEAVRRSAVGAGDSRARPRRHLRDLRPLHPAEHPADRQRGHRRRAWRFRPESTGTTRDQLHPSFSPDGKFLLFARRSLQGTLRLVMVDRKTGQAADLFNAFEAAADPPTTPVFSLDGTKVITGRRLEHRVRASAPTMPSRARSRRRTSRSSRPGRSCTGSSWPEVATRPRRAAPSGPSATRDEPPGVWHRSTPPADPAGRITVQNATGASTLADPTRRFANPAVATSLGVVVFESAPAATPFETKLVFRPLNGFATAATTGLPALVNANGVNVSNPAFSRDGRYLAFGRRTGSGLQLAALRLGHADATAAQPERSRLGARRSSTEASRSRSAASSRAIRCSAPAASAASRSRRTARSGSSSSASSGVTTCSDEQRRS